MRIEAQDPFTGKTTHTGSCYLTYVGLDNERRPAKLPKLLPANSTERHRFKEAMTRRKLREIEIAALREG